MMRPLFPFIITFCIFYSSFISHMNGFSVGTLNVNGAREVKKRALVLDTARSKRIDVLFLQEVHSDQGDEGDWEKEWEGQVVLSHNTTLSGG